MGEIFRAVRTYFTAVLVTMAGLVPGAAAEETYELGTGDKLRVRVFERPELSGEYAIRPPGALSIPSIGEIPVAGLTAPQLERTIAGKLELRTDHPNQWVSVEILEYRPFYVLGAVKSPGRYPYVIGMNVLHAIALAGGMEKLGRVGAGGRFDLLRMRQRLREQMYSLGVALARRARLTAEFERLANEPGETESRSVDFPEELSRYLSEAMRVEVMRREMSIISEQRNAIASEFASYQRMKSVTEEQIRAYDGQLVAKTKEAKLLQVDLTALRGLKGQKAAVPMLQLHSLQRLAAELEGEHRGLVASIARAKGQLERVAQDFKRRQHDRRMAVAEELKQVDGEISRLRFGIAEMNALPFEMQSSLIPNNADSGGDNGQVMIVRRGPEGMEVVVASDLTLVKPGDLVKIPAGGLAAASSSGLSRSATQSPVPVVRAQPLSAFDRFPAHVTLP